MTARSARTRMTASTLVVALVAALGAVAPAAVAATSPVLPAAAAPRAGEHTQAPAPTSVLVRYRDGATKAAKGRAMAAAHASLKRHGSRPELDVVVPAAGSTVAETIARLGADPAVQYAEPNATLRLAADPVNEELFPYQWGLENAGGDCAGGNTAYLGLTCTPNVDIDATRAWQTSTGAGVTVAVIDDGVDFSDPELEAQAWVNPGETGKDGSNNDKATNGIDDDGNGYVDDVHGVNLCGDASTQTLHRDGVDWHGTAVSSVLGAAANGVDMVGVAPDVKIMGVRWLVQASGCASVVDAVEAIDYAVANGADVINASWGGDNSLAIDEAIARAGDAGILVVAAAGNEGSTSRFYPAASSQANVLSVGAIDPDGYRSSFSNYGSWVDVAAPGAGIVAICLSWDPQECPDRRSLVFGTSFAAPHVSAIAALVLQAKPTLATDAVALRSKLINSGVASAKLDEGITGSGRRVNAGRAVDVTPPSAPLASVRAKLASTIGATSAPMAIVWPAATDASGIDGYRVRYRPAGSSTWTTVANWTTDLAALATLAYNTAYEVQVTARDRGGNLTSTTLTTTPKHYSESSTAVTYGGSWSLSTSTKYAGGKARATGTKGRSATFTVTGRSVSWVAAKGPTRGSATVFVDDTPVGTVSLYASSTVYRRVVWSRSWSTAGTHTIRIVVAGTSGHPRVDVDAFIVAK